MTSKKVFKGIGITLLVLVALAGVITGIILGCISNGRVDDSCYITYSNLKNVMQDDVVYLSDEFLTENNLSVGALEDSVYQNVILLYNNRKIKSSSDFTQRVEGIESYTYTLKSNNSADMSISVTVSGIAGNDDNIKIKCNQKTLDGYNYGLEGNGEIFYSGTSLFKAFVVKTSGKTSLINKKNCMLYVSVGIKYEDAQRYTEEEIISQIDKVIDSALNHIERYGN